MLPGMDYKGGKGQSGVYQAIINQQGKHNRYFELCLGGGSVMRNKLPASTNYGIDVDAGVIDKFRATAVIPDLKLLAADAIAFLRIFPFESSDLIYLDPPYLFSVRKSQAPIYKYEWTEAQHLEMLSIVPTVPAQIMISGYESAMYNSHLPKWRKVHFNAVDRAGEVRQETLWMNYPEPLELHDYRYVGRTFRDRYNLKRKVASQKRRLVKMKPLERLALMKAIQELTRDLNA